MSAARVAAFSLATTPYGWAAVAAYGVASLAATAYRMRKNYKQQKAQNPNLKKSDFFKQNWSGMLLSVVGTAASVVPGLAGSIGGLQGAVDVMRDSGLLAQTSMPGLSHLGMTNLSVAMVGAGVVDSTIRGTIAQRKEGEGLGKSLLYGSLSGVLSSAVGITTSVACSQVCNYAFDSGMNIIGDTRSTENIADSARGYVEREVSQEEFDRRIEEMGLRDEIDSLKSGTLTEDQYREVMTEVQETMAKEGLILKTSNDDNTDVIIKWNENVVQDTETAITNSTNTVKYWTSSDPKVYDENIKVLTSVVEEYNAQHPEAPLDANRVYHTMLLTGARAVSADVDTLQNHIDGGGQEACKGLHTSVTDGHILKHPEWGVNVEDAQAIRGVTDSNGIMDPEKVRGVIDSVALIEKHISEIGEVGQNSDTRANAHHDGYLHRNAAIDPVTGEHVHAESGKGTIFDTYVDGKSADEVVVYGNEEHLKAVQLQDDTPKQIYMPLNPEPLIFEGSKAYIAKIQGNNYRRTQEKGKRKEIKEEIIKTKILTRDK